MPLISTQGAASIGNFGVGAGKKKTFDPSSLAGYAAYHATDSTNSAAARSLLENYMAGKGIGRVDEAVGANTTIPNTYINSQDIVHIISDNSNFDNAGTWQPFPTEGSSSKIILFTFAGNVNSSSSYSLDLQFARLENRFYSGLNDGNGQTSSTSITASFLSGNPVVDNMNNINNVTFKTHRNKNSQIDGLYFNQNVGSSFNTEKYSFSNDTTNGGSFAMGVKNLDSNGGLVIINAFFDSIGNAYTGNFSSTAQQQIMDLTYCAAVWLTTPP